MEITGQRRADARLRLLARPASSSPRARAGGDGASPTSSCPGSRTPATSISPRATCSNGSPTRTPSRARAADGRDAEPLRRRAGRTRVAAPSGRQRRPLLASTLEPELLEALEQIGLDRAAFDRVGSNSMMFVPFVCGETLGVITLGARQPGRYTEDDLGLVRALAGRASAALDNARLVGELRRGRRRPRRSSSSVTASSSSTARASSGSGTRRRCESPVSVRRRWSTPQSSSRFRLAARSRRTGADVPGRRAARRALALAHGGRVPTGHGLCLSRPDRRARGRAAEERLRLNRLTSCGRRSRRSTARR